jgi:ribonuclease-3
MSGRSPAANLAELEARLGHTFSDKSLLERALIIAATNTDQKVNNERLEFLGDRVLGLVISEKLVRCFANVPVGKLARRLNALVSKAACARIAEALAIKDFVAENDATARVLADICEALIAAVYLDGGIEAARDMVLRHWAAALEVAEDTRRDPKSQLQEWALSRALPVPDYTVTARAGPDHAPLFTITVTVAGHAPVSGQGPSKREAEQAAAACFLDQHRIERT